MIPKQYTSTYVFCTSCFLLCLHLTACSAVSPQLFIHFQIEMMRQGGNGQIREFYKKLQIENSPITILYSTKGANHYRDRLKERADKVILQSSSFLYIFFIISFLSYLLCLLYSSIIFFHYFCKFNFMSVNIDVMLVMIDSVAIVTSIIIVKEMIAEVILIVVT